MTTATPDAEPGPALVELRGVTRRYDTVGAVTVLDGVDLQVGRGEAVAVVGPSGCGKSTLLNLIGGLDRPDQGQVFLDGTDLAQLGDDDLARVRNRTVGFVFQSHHLLPQCSALENVLVPTLVSGTSAADVERARALLDRVGLGPRMDHRPAQLSGGECQRVALVRALVNEPPVLLADEPTGALDAQSAEQLGELLVELNRERGVTLITVTHSQELAKSMGRRLLLQHGRLQPAP